METFINKLMCGEQGSIHSNKAICIYHNIVGQLSIAQDVHVSEVT